MNNGRFVEYHSINKRGHCTIRLMFEPADCKKTVSFLLNKIVFLFLQRGVAMFIKESKEDQRG